MPTSTFFNLSQAKQQRLLDAAHQEFSRVSLHEASISKIVLAAGIPRGSFYQYFTDKEDLYYCYSDYLRQHTKNSLLDSLKATEGDLFAAFRRYFTTLTAEFINGPNAAFYKNMFLNMTYKNSRKVALSTQMKHAHHGHSDFYANVDFSRLKISTAHELGMLMHILMSALFQTLGSYYLRQQHDEPVTVAQLDQEFEQTLGWLEHGVAIN
ncbi:TetR/AcrR family transcriptional regulator [Loigolactobacillus zhaoyuanensis]|uniref:TetR/AcrR family transcriptional regulator n=1 Tax=Loigolactobacillus zhaoyuanensis TaxID=2486017 RepID=UPI000F73CB3C|nr:TetR/AcrR family transcriptional regulator [Loigolactobacillus zhaoyuanensis]